MRPSTDKVIQLLERFQQRKEEFVYPLNLQAVEHFLTGFRAACAACGFEIPRKLKQQVLERRGWKHSAAGPAAQMRDKGMSDEAIIDELIRLEIEQLKQLGDKLTASAAPAAAHEPMPARKSGKWWWPGREA
jgi:hypothetical protein